MLKPKSGVLTPFQKKVLEFFSNLKDSKHFFLTGGMALAEFYLGHRKSFDLDMFTSEKELILPFSRVLEEEMKKVFSVTVTRRFETFVEYEIGVKDKSESIKVQLAYDSPYHLDSPSESALGIKINSFKDLVTDKLQAFFGRMEPRDAVDLYFILRGGVRSFIITLPQCNRLSGNFRGTGKPCYVSYIFVARPAPSTFMK